MPNFFYTAKLQDGRTQTGYLEAKDENELGQALHKEGLFLVSAENQESQKGTKSFWWVGVSAAEKLFFVRNLRVMVAAGISLPRAIGNLALQSRNEKFKKSLLAIQEKISRGSTLSQSLQDYPQFFSPLFQNMVKAGEESGTLEEVLKNLSHQLAKEVELRSKIVGALIYPLVVVSAMVGIGILMLIVVVPQLAETFAELSLELPLTTKIVIGLGTFLRQRWYFLPLIALMIFFALERALKTRRGKMVFDRAFLRLPLVSGLVRETSSAIFSRTLGSLVSSGIALPQALEIISGTMGNVYFQESLKTAAEKIRRGAKLSEALSPYKNLYLPIVVQMLEVGEETGETSQVLDQLADFLEEEVANTTKNLASALEPVLMLLVGAAVGFFAVSMLQPMYSMLEAVK